MHMSLLPARKQSTEEIYTEQLQQHYPHSTKLTIKDASLQINRPVGTIHSYIGRNAQGFQRTFIKTRGGYRITLEALAKLLAEEGRKPVPPDSIPQEKKDELWETAKQEKRKAKRKAKLKNAAKSSHPEGESLRGSGEQGRDTRLEAIKPAFDERFTPFAGEGMEANPDDSKRPCNSAAELPGEVDRNLLSPNPGWPASAVPLFNPAARVRQILNRQARRNGVCTLSHQDG